MAIFSQYENKNGTKYWQVKAYLGIDELTGKQVLARKKGFLTKRAATVYLDEQKAKFNQNGTLKKTKMLFEEVYELWLQNYRLTVKESSYVKLLGKFRVHILPVFGAMMIKDITTNQIQLFVNDLSTKLVSFKEYAYNLSRVLDFAVKQGLLVSNPAINIIMPKCSVESVERGKKFYSISQQKKLLAYAEENETIEIFAFFQLLVTTGCREGELLGLFWDDVDFDKGMIRIRRTLTRGINRRLYLGKPKTKNSWRIVELTKKTANVLIRWQSIQKNILEKNNLKFQNEEQLIFSNSENSFTELTHPRLWLMRINKRAGLPMLSPHALRHSFVSTLVNNGVDPHSVSKLLGHASVATTLDIYADIFQEKQMEASRIVERSLEQ